MAAFLVLGLTLHLWAQSDWTVRRTGTPSLSTVTWSGNKFIAVGLDSILSSPDGITWISRPSPVCCLSAVIWADSQFVAVGGVLYVQPNPNPLPKHTGSRFVALGDSVVGTNSNTSFGYALTSTDGITWTQRNTGASFPLASVVWTGSRLVAVGGDGRAYVSLDGTIWTSHQAASGGTILHTVTWTGSQLVAVGGSTIAISDASGTSWKSQTKSSGLSSVASGNGMLVAVGDSIISSPDGIVWTPRHSGIGAGLSDVTWTGSEFVVVGNGGGNGIVLTSSNGNVWAARNPGPSVGLYAIAVSNRQLVALGTNRSILTSHMEPSAILAPSAHSTFPIRLTSSHLFATIPKALGTNPRVVLYASSGRKIAEVEINPTASEAKMQIGNLEPGVYVLVMRSKNSSLQHTFSLTR